MVLAGAAGNTVGNIILYELARKKGAEYVEALAVKFYRVPRETFRAGLQKVHTAFEKKGAWFLFAGKLIPALKVFVPIPAGIAKMNRVLYAAIIFITSALWTLPFLSIGYFFGKSSDVFGTYALVLLVIALFVVWLFWKYMNSKEVTQRVEGVK